MKKVLSVIVLTLLIISFSAVASASSEKAVNLDDIGLSIVLPEADIVLTRNTKENAPELEKIGITKDQLVSYLVSNDMFLYVVGNEYVITVGRKASTYDDFLKINDNLVLLTVNDIEKDYKAQQITVNQKDLYYCSNAKYIQLHSTTRLNNSKQEQILYLTSCNGYLYALVYSKLDSRLTSYDEKNAKEIVESIVFNEATNQSDAFSSEFKYTDSSTGISFTVPKNWVEGSLSKKRKVLKACFESEKENGTQIYYGSFDLWNNMPSFLKLGHKREDLDTKTIYKALFGLSDDDWTKNINLTNSSIIDSANIEDVRIVFRKGKDYILFSTTSTSSSDLGSLTLSMDTYAYVEDGIFYEWQCDAFSTNPIYNDFLSLIDSAEYPSPKGLAGGAWFSWNIVDCVLGILVTILIHPLPIWIYRRFIKKEAIDSDNARRIVNIDTVVVAVVFIVFSFFFGGGLSIVALLFWRKVCLNILVKKSDLPSYESSGDRTNSEFIKEQNDYSDGANSQFRIVNSDDRSVNRKETKLRRLALARKNKNDMSSSDENDGIEVNNGKRRNVSLDVEAEQKSEVVSSNNERKFKYCWNCGAKLAANSNFCHVCGTKLD